MALHLIRFLESYFQNTQEREPLNRLHGNHSCLQELANSTLQKLHSIISPAERKEEWKRVGTHLLESIPPSREPLSWRQFALRHNGAIISSTSFHGGLEAESLSDWLFHLQNLQQGDDSLFNTPLSPEIIARMGDALETQQMFYRLLPPKLGTALREDQAQYYGQRLRLAIFEQLQKGKAIYVPAGYRAGTKTSGHAMVLKCELKGTRVELSILNLGNGAEINPILDHSATHQRRSYRSLPICFDVDRLFHSEDGLAAWTMFIRYQSDPGVGSMAYEGEDIFNLFTAIGGEVIPSLGKDPQKYQAKFQRFPTCSEKATRLTLRDILVEEAGLSYEEMKLFFFNQALCSFARGYQDYQAHPSAANYRLLLNAAEEMSVGVRKRATSLHKEEIAMVDAAVHAVTSLPPPETKIVDSQAATATSSRDQILRRTTFKPIDFKKAVHAADLGFKTIMKKREARTSTCSLYQPILDQSQVKQTFEKWATDIQRMSRQRAADFLYDSIQTLPIPAWGEKDFWDQIPQEQIPEILKLMQQMVYEGIATDSWGSQLNRYFSVFNTFYVIADKLCRRLKETKLAGFASPLFVLERTIWPRDFVYIPLAQDNIRCARIRAYFQACKKASTGHNQVIFPMGRLLPIERLAQEARYGWQNSQGIAHIRYLNQFLGEEGENLSNRERLERYKTLWQQQGPVSILYYFATLSEMIHHTRGTPEDCPETLVFKPEKDTEEKAVLTMEGIRWQYWDDNWDYDHFEFGFKRACKHLQRNLFDEYILSYSMKNLDTNGSVTFNPSKEKTKLRRPIVRDLLRITRNEHLSVPEAFAWMEEHPLLMTSCEITHSLEYALFAPGRLMHTLQTSPGFIHEIRRILRQQLEYHQNNIYRLHTILFIIRTALSVEGYCEQQDLKLLKACRQELLLLRAKTKQQKEIDFIDLHLIHLCAQTQTIQEDFLIDSLLLAFKFSKKEHLEFHCPDWLEENRRPAMRTMLYRLPPSLHLPFVERIAEELDLKTAPGAWKGTFPTFSCEKYSIDLLEGVIRDAQKRRVEDLHPTPSVSHTKNLKQRMKGRYYEGDEKDEMIREDGMFKQVDKSYYRRFIPDGPWYELVKLNGSYLDTLNLGFLVDHEEFNVYFNAEKNVYLIRRDEDDTPYLSVKSIEGGRTEVRRDDLPNVQLLPINRTPYKERFNAPNEIAAFFNMETKELVEINFFRFGGKGMKFKRKGDQLVNDDGAVLLLDHPLPELQGYKPAIVIEKKGKREVIIEFRLLDSKTEDYVVTLAPRSCKISPEGHAPATYTLHPLTGRLHSDNLCNMFYLIYMLMQQHQYVRASTYLKQIHLTRSFTPTELSFFNSYLLTHDNPSPHAYAFRTQLFIFYLEITHLLSQQRLGKSSTEALQRACLQKGVDAYTSYLRCMSVDSLSTIPVSLHLTIEQEKMLIRILKKFYKDCKIDFPKILEVRFQLLWSFGEPVDIELEPTQKVCIAPTVYSQVLLPKDLRPPFSMLHEEQKISQLNPTAVRYDDQAFDDHFLTLAKEALCCPKTPCAFDLKIITALKCPYSKTLGSLLFYIRHQPEAYRDLLLSNEMPLDNLKAALIEWTIKQDFDPKKLVLQEVTYDYAHKKVLLPLEAPAQSEQPTETEVEEKITPNPLKHLCEALFDKRVEPLHVRETPLPKTENPFEEEVHDKIAIGITKLKKQTKTDYTLKEDPPIDRIREDIISSKEEVKATLQALRQEISMTLNTPLALRQERLQAEELVEEIGHYSQLASYQRKELDPEWIMEEVILNRAFETLSHERPLATKDAERKRNQTVIEKTKEFYHQMALLKMHEKALAHLDHLPKEREQLATLLDYTFLYDPHCSPEISHFIASTGIFLRPRQVEAYRWACEGIATREHGLVQMPAGQGKSAVLTPLLLRSIAIYTDCLPIDMTSRAIYTLDKQTLSKTTAKLHQKLALLELGLHMQLHHDDYQFIYFELERMRATKQALIITPSVLYALHLHYQQAGVEKDAKNLLWIGKILNLLKKKSIAIIDEAPFNLNPQTRAIFGSGDVFYPTKTEIALFLNLMRPLIGLEELKCGGSTAATLIHLNKNGLSPPSAKSVKSVQKAMAEKVCRDYNLDAAFVDYLYLEEGKRPDYLDQMEPNQANEIALCRHCLMTLLPQIVRLRTEFDHCPSSYPEEEFEIPCCHKTPSTAQYQDPWRTLLLSIVGTLHRGLDERQLTQLITLLLEKEWKEQSIHDAKTNIEFMSWLKGSKLEGCCLRDINLSNPEQMKRLLEVLSKHPVAVFEYLSKVILKQISHTKQETVATPEDLLHSFAQATLFTATPSSSLLYPSGIKRQFFSPEFEAEVVEAYQRPENQKRIPLPEESSIFRKEILQGYAAIIDPGGLLDIPNQEVAQNTLDANSQLDGVLYFSDPSAEDVDGKENLCLLKRGEKKPLLLDGNKIPQEWEKLHLLTYYDAAHSIAAHVDQPHGAKALILLTHKVDHSTLVQGTMRMRELLSGKHTLSWVIPEGLDVGEDIYSWSVANEAQLLKEKAILSAFHKVSFATAMDARKELDAIVDPDVEEEEESDLPLEEELMHCFEKYESGFLHSNTETSLEMYGGEIREETVDPVLREHAYRFYDAFNYLTPFDQNAPLQTHLSAIIAETQTKLKTISTLFHKSSSYQVEQKRQQKRQTEEEDLRPRKDPLKAAGDYGDVDIYKREYLTVGLNSKKAHSYYCSKGLTPDFRCTTNHMRTAQRGSQIIDDYWKPIDYFMIVFHPEGRFALAESNQIIEAEFRKLLDPPKEEGEMIDHRVLLVSSSLDYAFPGKEQLKPTKKEMKVLDSQWLEDLKIDAALLRGKVRNPERLLERIRTWPGGVQAFQTFWKHIIECQPDKETVDFNAMVTLIEKI